MARRRREISRDETDQLFKEYLLYSNTPKIARKLGMSKSWVQKLFVETYGADYAEKYQKNPYRYIYSTYCKKHSPEEVKVWVDSLTVEEMRRSCGHIDDVDWRLDKSQDADIKYRTGPESDYRDNVLDEYPSAMVDNVIYYLLDWSTGQLSYTAEIDE